MMLPDLDKHFAPVFAILSDVNSTLDQHDELESAAEKDLCASACRFLLGELERRLADLQRLLSKTDEHKGAAND